MDRKISDVAFHAKVSPATVSRVLNNNPSVNEKTRLRVLKVIEELDYVPHAAAKNLRMQKTMTIGVIVSDVGASYFSDVIRGIENKAYSEKFKVVICDTQNDPGKEREYLRLLMDRSVDGVILVTSTLSKSEVLELVAKGYLVGIVGRQIEHEGILSVYTDNVKAATEAVEHLIGQGHREIVFMSGYADAADSFERLEGYIRALREHGIPFRPELVENGNFNEAGGCAAFKRLIDKNVNFTAVFSANDEMALGVYTACREFGIRIPHEVAIVGVDNDRICKFLSPSLSTIDQPKYQMGYELADRLIRQLAQTEQVEPRVSCLDSRLIIRESSVIPG